MDGPTELVSSVPAGSDHQPGVDRASVRDRTREAILETALNLYRHSGYSGVTIRALGNEMGLKAPSLYHYFESKEEMFVLLQQRALRLQEQLMLEELTDNPLVDIEVFYGRYMEFAAKYPEYFTLLYIDPAVPARVKDQPEDDSYGRLRDGASLRIQRCIDAGVFPAGLDELLVGRLLWHAALGAAVLRQSHPEIAQSQGGGSFGIRFILEGVRSGLLQQTMGRSPHPNNALETKESIDLDDERAVERI